MAPKIASQITQESTLDDTLAVIEDLEKSLNQKQRLWDGIRKNNPTFEEVSKEECRDKCARIWLHGATEFNEVNELERWLYVKVAPSKLAQSNANRVISKWRKANGDKGPIGTYYIDNIKFNLKAKARETLYVFINRKAEEAEKNGKGHWIRWRALNSFIHYLLGNYDQEETAFIEQILPRERDLAYGRIIRKIPPEAYPISFQYAAVLVSSLAQLLKRSRSNAQLGIAETLGFCWVCLTASRLRLPTQINMLVKIKASAIDITGKKPTIQIPTLFGNSQIFISRRIATYLLAIAKISSKKPRETIFQKPLRSLREVLEKTLKSLPHLTKEGPVTFRTLLNPPHIFGEKHRCRPKRPQSTS